MMQESRTPPLNEEEVPKQSDNIPWWLNYMCTGMGILAGVVTFGTGVLALTSILSPSCIFAGLYMLLLGSFVLMIEASCCCQHVEALRRPVNLASKLGPLQKAFFYILASLLMFMCFGITRLIPIALIILTGVLNGFSYFKSQNTTAAQAWQGFAARGYRLRLSGNNAEAGRAAGGNMGGGGGSTDDMKAHLVDQATTGAINAAQTPQGRAVLTNAAMGAAQQQGWGGGGGGGGNAGGYDMGGYGAR